MRHQTGRHEALGRDDHLIAGPPGQPAANDRLATTDFFASRRVGVGRVQERYPRVERRVHDSERLVGFRSRAESHGSEADL